jgi:hypothetical protein
MFPRTPYDGSMTSLMKDIQEGNIMAESHKPAITDPQYWDAFWRNGWRPLLKENDLAFGSRGFFLKAIERVTGSLEGRSVLELGGAFSYCLIGLSKYRNMHATAIDYAPKAAQESETFYQRNGCQIDMICGDFFSHSFGRTFDLVTHWGVVEHEPEPEALIRRSIELCTPCGHVVLTMPQMLGLGGFLWRTLSPKIWSRHIYHSDETIIQAFAKYGWQCSPFFFGVPLIHMTPTEAPKVVDVPLRAAQYGVAKLGRLLPYQYGLRYISQCRGFVATASSGGH